MLDGKTVRAMDLWCGGRALNWSVAHRVGGKLALMLRPLDHERSWRQLRLVLGTGEMRVENEQGEMLASASGLPALLDAVDGGVAERVASASRSQAGLLREQASTTMAVVF